MAESDHSYGTITLYNHEVSHPARWSCSWGSALLRFLEEGISLISCNVLLSSIDVVGWWCTNYVLGHAGWRLKDEFRPPIRRSSDGIFHCCRQIARASPDRSLHRLTRSGCAEWYETKGHIGSIIFLQVYVVINLYQDSGSYFCWLCLSLQGHRIAARCMLGEEPIQLSCTESKPESVC